MVFIFYFSISLLLSIQSLVYTMYPDSPHPVAQQEFATDASGANYSRYGSNAPWVPIGPQLLPSSGGGLNISVRHFLLFQLLLLIAGSFPVSVILLLMEVSRDAHQMSG